MHNRLFIWFLLVLLIVFRYQSTLPGFTDGQRIRINQTVLSEPIKYDNYQGFSLMGLKVYLPLYPEISYGDKVIIEGVVKDGKLENAELIKVTKTTNFLHVLRSKIISFYKKNIPEPHSSLIAGVTIGAKSDIPENFWDSLKTSGTAHVVVASGMNVTLVAGFLVAVLLIFLPRKQAVMVALIGIWLYALVSGFDAPIIRAAIMGSIAFGAQGLGRLNYAWRALFLSAFLMLIVNPSWIYDLGFLLSFTATASLLLFGNRIKRYVEWVPGLFREGLYTSLAAQIGVAPILYYTFGSISIWSPVVNALVLWTIGPITTIGMIAGILGIIFEPLGRILLWLIYPLTSWFVFIVGVFG